MLIGQPVPRSQLLYFKDEWLVRNLWLARLATDVYVRLRYPPVSVPDSTEELVGMIREFVEGNGAKFMVGIQYRDEALAHYLETNRIPFAKLEGAPFYSEAVGFGPHWTSEGHKFVAERILGLLSANNIVHRDAAAHNRLRIARHTPGADRMIGRPCSNENPASAAGCARCGDGGSSGPDCPDAGEDRHAAVRSAPGQPARHVSG